MVNLKYRKEFETALESYQPNAEARELLDRIPLAIMLGVSGAGRNTIINHLLALGKYYFIVSDTTRPPKFRDGAMEVDGVNYNFRSEEEILSDIKDGLFLEAEIIHNQQVSGINMSELIKAEKSGKIPINEVDIGGTESIRFVKPDTKFFFVVPPNFEEWMYRLKGREVMTDTELNNRLQTAVTVLDGGLGHNEFIFIINDSSHRSAMVIDEVLHGQEIGDQEQQDGREIARKLREDTQQYLSTH